MSSTASAPVALSSAPESGPRARSRASEVEHLRRAISRMQQRRSESRTLALHPALEGLLPDGGLHLGAAYSLTPSPSLIGALLCTPSQQGTWCAIVGMPTVGAEALSGLGVDLARLVVVPEPGARWLSVVSALAEVIPLIVLRPSSRLSDGDHARLQSRLRDRGCTLLVTAPWPQSAATIQITESAWNGLGHGWGVLAERTVTLQSVVRGTPRAHSVRVQLPSMNGELLPAPLAPLRSLPRAASPLTSQNTNARREEQWAVAG